MRSEHPQVAGRAGAIGVHLAGAAWVVSRHLLYRQQRVEIGQATAAVFGRRGHAQQPLPGELFEAYATIVVRLGLERVISKLAPGKVGHHAFDGDLFSSERHPASSASSSIAASSMSTPSPAGN